MTLKTKRFFPMLHRGIHVGLVKNAHANTIFAKNAPEAMNFFVRSLSNFFLTYTVCIFTPGHIFRAIAFFSFTIENEAVATTGLIGGHPI